jgi:hypothetical protein
MDSSSDRQPDLEERARPSDELLQKLRDGKASLRAKRMALPLPEKVRQVLELQRLHLPLIARQRRLRSWERPWDVEP